MRTVDRVRSQAASPPLLSAIVHWLSAVLSEATVLDDAQKNPPGVSRPNDNAERAWRPEERTPDHE
jgi:hypothetical protein